MTKTERRVQIRWMIRRDLPEILEVERACFRHPWTEEDFLCFLRQRNCICMVAEDERCEIVGYMAYGLDNNESIDLWNFAVYPPLHRQGIGSQMIDRLKMKLRLHKPAERTRITATVSEVNLGGQLFFKANGFTAVGVKRGFFDHLDCSEPEDGYEFVYSLRKGRATR